MCVAVSGKKRKKKKAVQQLESRSSFRTEDLELRHSVRNSSSDDSPNATSFARQGVILLPLHSHTLCSHTWIGRRVDLTSSFLFPTTIRTENCMPQQPLLLLLTPPIHSLFNSSLMNRISLLHSDEFDSSLLGSTTGSHQQETLLPDCPLIHESDLAICCLHHLHPFPSIRIRCVKIEVLVLGIYLRQV